MICGAFEGGDYTFVILMTVKWRLKLIRGRVAHLG